MPGPMHLNVTQLQPLEQFQRVRQPGEQVTITITRRGLFFHIARYYRRNRVSQFLVGPERDEMTATDVCTPYTESQLSGPRPAPDLTRLIHPSPLAKQQLLVAGNVTRRRARPRADLSRHAHISRILSLFVYVNPTYSLVFWKFLPKRYC